jgi:hypothetical protein
MLMEKSRDADFSGPPTTVGISVLFKASQSALRIPVECPGWHSHKALERIQSRQ